MAEKITLTTPVTTPTITDVRVASLLLDWDGAQISVTLRDTNGGLRHELYTGSTATALIVALNKADLSANSLQRRILARLITDGRLAGSVSGTPD